MVAASKRLCNTEAQQEQQLATACVCVAHMTSSITISLCPLPLPLSLSSMAAENVRTIHHMLSLRLGSLNSSSFCWQLLKLPAGCLSLLSLITLSLSL